MEWTGTWRNQYGSVLRVTSDADNHITGTFRTALSDSGFYGEEVPVVGVHRSECVSFSFARDAAAGATIASFTGRLCDGRLETVWQVVSEGRLTATAPGEPARIEKLPWPHAAMANADTFERLSPSE